MPPAGVGPALARHVGLKVELRFGNGPEWCVGELPVHCLYFVKGSSSMAEEQLINTAPPNDNLL